MIIIINQKPPKPQMTHIPFQNPVRHPKLKCYIIKLYFFDNQNMIARCIGNKISMNILNNVNNSFYAKQFLMDQVK